MQEILFLSPVCTHNIWGGTRLREEYGYQESGDDIGECWGISAHPNGDASIREGKYKGWKLSKLWREHPELFGNLPEKEFPLLVKMIDARNDLSIQVHPDDKYAKIHENGSYGKEENWYVLDCPENATLVVGHNASSKEEMLELIQGKRWKEWIREIPIHKGDMIQIEPGTVHAIRGGTLILETQQNSDITYRVYDYDRLSNGKPRELHLKKSMDVITVPAKPVEECLIRKTETLSNNELHCVAKNSHFSMYQMQVCGEAFFHQSFPFLNLSVIEGEGSIQGKRIKKGDHFVIPNKSGLVCMQGNMKLLGSTISSQWGSSIEEKPPADKTGLPVSNEIAEKESI